MVLMPGEQPISRRHSVLSRNSLRLTDLTVRGNLLVNSEAAIDFFSLRNVSFNSDDEVASQRVLTSIFTGTL